MSKITSIDGNVCRDIRKAVQDALASVEAEFGVDIIWGSISYDPESNLRGKLTVKIKGTDGSPLPTITKVMTPAAMTFQAVAKRYGLDPNHLWAEITIRGKRYMIVGLNPRRHRYPISAKRLPDGRGFKFPVRDIKQALGIKD